MSAPPSDPGRRRRSRQSRTVLGVGLVLLAGVSFLLAPDLTGPLVKDLPYIAVALVSVFVGGILLGAGGARPPRPAR